MMKPKKTFHAHVLILLMIFSFMRLPSAFAQTGDKAEQIRAELIRYHMKAKKDNKESIISTLVMAGLYFAMADRLEKENENIKRGLNISAGLSLASALYSSWQYMNEAKIIKKVQQMDMQKANLNAITHSLHKKLKQERLWGYFSLVSSAFSTGMSIYTAQNFTLVPGKENHKNDLRNFHYFRAAYGGYLLYDSWWELRKNKRDTLRLKEITQ